MKRTTKCLLYLQYLMGRLFVVIVGPLMFVAVRLMGYRVRELSEMRKTARDLFKQHKGPWIICPNHLTMIDSVIVAYAIAPLYLYMLQYRLLPWNLPEQANFQSNIFLTIICYLAKCVPVHRGGDRGKMKATLDTCQYLLEKKEGLLIFPEGGRSRTGRVDTENFSYGVGRLIAHAPDCRVLCVYLRGDGQKAYSGIPKFGEHFTGKTETFIPDMENSGLKAQRSCARQIVERLARMEKECFDRQ